MRVSGSRFIPEVLHLIPTLHMPSMGGGGGSLGYSTLLVRIVARQDAMPAAHVRQAELCPRHSSKWLIALCERPSQWLASQGGSFAKWPVGCGGAAPMLWGTSTMGTPRLAGSSAHGRSGSLGRGYALRKRSICRRSATGSHEEYGAVASSGRSSGIVNNQAVPTRRGQ